MRFLIAGPIPWLLPGVVVSLVVALVTAGWLGRRLRVHPMVAALMVVGLGLIVSATLTPLRDALEDGLVGAGTCDLSRWWPNSPTNWTRLSDPVRNILMFIPLGVAIGLVPLSRVKIALVAGAIGLPFAIEAVQLLAPVLARSCESADVVDNLTGLAIGLVGGALLGWLGVGRASQRPDIHGMSDGGEAPSAGA